MLKIDFNELVEYVRTERDDLNGDMIDDVIVVMKEMGIFSSEYVEHIWETYAVSQKSDLRAKESIERMASSVSVNKPIKIYASRKAMDSTVISIMELGIRIYVINIHADSLYKNIKNNRLACELYNIFRLLAYWKTYRETDFALAKLKTLIDGSNVDTSERFEFMPEIITVPKILKDIIGRDKVIVSGPVLLGGSGYVLVYADRSWRRFIERVKKYNRNIPIENDSDVDFVGEYLVINANGNKILIVNGSRKTIQYKTYNQNCISAFPLAMAMTALYELVAGGAHVDLIKIAATADLNTLLFDTKMESAGRGFVAYEEYQRSAFERMSLGQNWKWEYKKTIMPKAEI